MNSILCVHQGYELYGSDRIFLLSLRALKFKYPDSVITVHLPREGALSREIEKSTLANTVIFEPMCVLRKSDLKKFRFGNLIKGVFAIPAKTRFCDKFDLIYVNSVVVIDYLLVSRFTRSRVVLQVHEIPSKIHLPVFLFLLKLSKTYCLFVSEAVKNCFKNLPGEVVLNGIKGFEYRERKFDQPINLLQIGRINGWKGQDLLLEALTLLKKKTMIRFKLKIVGDVFEDQNHYLEELRRMVEQGNLQEQVEFCAFDPNPSSFYDWSDIVIVPSKKQEPFGLVAIEAMSSGSVVVVAGHGGLTEIVVDGKNGVYFKPNSAFELYKILVRLATSPVLCKQLSNSGYKEYLSRFSESAYISRFQLALNNFTKEVQEVS